VNFLIVHKLIKKHSSISEQETPRYILLAINKKMINLKIIELLKSFPLSWNLKFRYHRQKKMRLPHYIRYNMYPVCIQTGYFSKILLKLFC
jgi:hypothetical protein